MNRRYVRACIGIVALGLIASSCALALDSEKRISQFTHRSWASVQGVGEVYSIAQTTDGYLWLATSNGTFRFDGYSFTRLETDSKERARVETTPYRVLGSRDGSLWISRGETVVRIRNEKRTVYSENDGLPGGLVHSLREETDGSIWVTGSSGLSRFSAERWQKFGVKDVTLLVPLRTTFQDSKQNLWTIVFDESQVRHMAAVLRPGDTTFRIVGDAGFETTRLAEAPDGKIWAAQWPRRAVRLFIPDQMGPKLDTFGVDAASRDFLFDRDGAMWIATLDKGLQRVRNAALRDQAEVGKLITDDRFTQKDGLSSDNVRCVFEGREGEIWVGTSGGLDFFGENKFTSISSREGLPFDKNLLLQRLGRNDILVASTEQGFEKIETAGQQIENLKWLGMAAEDIPARIHSLYSDPRGGVLAGTSYGILAIRDDGSGADFLPGTTHLLPNGILVTVTAMARDHRGALWICDEIGVYRLQQERLERVPLPLSSRLKFATTCHVDRDGRVWMGFVDRSGDRLSVSLVCHDGNEAQWYSENDGLFSGRITGFLNDAEGRLWIAGEGGLSQFDHGRFQTLTRQNGLPDDNLLAILQDDEGFFWLAAPSGLFRVDPRDLENALKSGTVKGDFFGVQEGLRGYIRSLTGWNRGAFAAKSADGRLWFPTSVGVTTINPRRIFRNAAPPPVHIQKIIAREKSYDPATFSTLPPGIRDIEFNYVGLCFTNPEKVRHRYKLEGYDDHWVEAGARRQAFYSHLKPGHYTFRVLASNNDGVWNENGAAVSFFLAPAFYERTWFLVVWLLPVALALWAVHRLRMARLAARANLRLESQVVERQRIARELHDTLLQGFVGVGLKLEAIATNLPDSLASVRDQLRKILDQADQYLVEARRSVVELRSASLERNDNLVHALAAATGQLTEGTGVQLSYVVDGPRTELPPHLESNLLRIGEEAVSNAVRHARPTKVEVHLQFGRKELQLRIRDNGRGFDPKGPEATKAGHFGLIGMRERVKALGGHLTLTSRPGKGAEITVTVPRRHNASRRWFRNFF